MDADVSQVPLSTPGGDPSPAAGSPTMDDPLYKQATGHVQAGEWAEAEAALAELARRFPDAAEVQELLAETRLRTRASQAKPRIRFKHRPLLTYRSIRLLIVANVLLILAFPAYLLYREWQRTSAISRELATQQQLLKQAETALGAGQWDQAISSYQEYLRHVPDEPAAVQAIAQAESKRTVEARYNGALQLFTAGQWDEAIPQLANLAKDQPGYRNVDQLLSTAELRSHVSHLYADAEGRFAASNWKAAIATFESLRSVDQVFQQDKVKPHLFESYIQAGIQVAGTAGDSVEPLRQASFLFDRALSLYPLDPQASTERRLADWTYQGTVLFQYGYYTTTVTLLQPVVETRPQYAHGRAASVLYEAYTALGDLTLAGGERNAVQAAEYYDKATAVTMLWPDGGEIRRFESQFKAALARALIPPPKPEPDPNAGLLEAARSRVVIVSYTVQNGDTLDSLAYRFGSTVDLIALASHVSPAAPLQPGQTVSIPQVNTGGQ